VKNKKKRNNHIALGFSFLQMFNSNRQASSDDDDDDVLSKQVLPMNDDFQGSIDLTQMPTTGEEYLRQVR